MSASGERKHALCSASGASRWLACPGSVGMSIEAPEPPTSEYAEEGTKAHALAEKALRLWQSKGDNAAIDLLTGMSRKDIDDDGFSMADYVRRYVAGCIIEAVKYDQTPKPAVQIEARLTLSVDLAMYGTADFVMTGLKGGSATGLVRDLKYGKGIKVVAEANPQFAYYAVALMRMSTKQLESVTVIGDQPRIENGVTEVTYSREELEQWYGVLTRGAEKALTQAMTKKYELHAGPHCRFCPAKGGCDEHLRHQQSTAALDFTESTLPTVASITPERIGRILAAKSEIENFLTSVKEYALGVMKNGGTIPGFKVVQARTHRRWSASEEEVAAFIESFGEDAYEKKLRSPAQIEKAIKTKVPDHLVMKPEGVLTIAAESDSRQAALIAVDEFTDEAVNER